jgi:hypothetical protein
LEELHTKPVPDERFVVPKSMRISSDWTDGCAIIGATSVTRVDMTVILPRGMGPTVSNWH